MLHRKSVLPFFITVITPHSSSSSSLPCISPSPLPSYFSSLTHSSYVHPFYYFLALFNFFLFLFRPVSFFLRPSLSSPYFLDTIIPFTLSSSTCHPTAISGYGLDNTGSISCRNMDFALRLFPDTHGRPAIFLTNGCRSLSPHE